MTKNNNSIKLLSHQPTRLSCLEYLLCMCSCAVRKKQLPFSMAIAYRKCGTYAGVFSQTVTPGYSKKEIRQTEEDGKKRGANYNLYGKELSRHERKMKSQWPVIPNLGSQCLKGVDVKLTI